MLLGDVVVCRCVMLFVVAVVCGLIVCLLFAGAVRSSFFVGCCLLRVVCWWYCYVLIIVACWLLAGVRCFPLLFGVAFLLHT